MKYDAVITIDSEEEKNKAKKEDPDTPRDPYIEKRENITAYQFMKEGVDRMIVICEHLKVKDPVNGNERIHGNFVNLTDDDRATANVPADQTLSLSLDLYETTLKINIFQRFVCKPLTGVESQVSSLCHELSHYYRSGENGKYGGMGTDDIPTKGGFSREKNYLGTAKDLKKNGNQYVFKNAYNVEKYFCLGLSDEEKADVENEK